MPLYDYVCKRCNFEFEFQTLIAKRDAVICKKCGARTSRKVARTKDDWFKPFATEDFNGELIEVRSKEHYKQLCREHGVYAPHCFGQGFNISEI